jgi:hypothetical protein
VLAAVATDVNGLSSTSSSISVTVSNAASPPVLSNVTATAITSSSATITWTTNVASSSQVAYGTTSGYGQSTTLDSTAVTSHSAVISGLSPGTFYHYQARSTNAAGTGVSVDLTFTTSTGATTLFQLNMNATEVSGTTNGSVVTPAITPAGFTGTLMKTGTGSVNFAPAQVGNGAYFLNCCDPSNTAFYKFTGSTLGSIFNVAQGQITFYLKSRASFATRVGYGGNRRAVFTVTDSSLTRLFFFSTGVKLIGSENYLEFEWRVGNGLVAGYTTYFLWIDPSNADTLFGNGVTMKVTMKWNGTTNQLYLNDVLVQNNNYAPVTPNWGATSVLDMGVLEDLTSSGYSYGGYDACDDIINAFTILSQ